MFVADSKRLTHQGAKKIMATALELAAEARIAIACAIVDAGGHVILIERMDGGRFHTVHSCTTKAVCAASNRRPTTAKGAAQRTQVVVVWRRYSPSAAGAVRGPQGSLQLRGPGAQPPILHGLRSIRRSRRHGASCDSGPARPEVGWRRAQPVVRPLASNRP